ncbi:hypothetical protein, partial [Pantoea ananatis]|uniref:hypothetical protein n=1 Tax=Pantoea ananas TaxID=553 RepID=UPI0021F6E4CD
MIIFKKLAKTQRFFISSPRTERAVTSLKYDFTEEYQSGIVVKSSALRRLSTNTKPHHTNTHSKTSPQPDPSATHALNPGAIAHATASPAQSPESPSTV